MSIRLSLVATRPLRPPVFFDLRLLVHRFTSRSVARLAGRDIGVALSVVLILAACLALQAPTAANGQGADPLAGFPQYVNDVLAAFEVPGAAVAVVRNGDVLMASGFGVKTLGAPDPVNASTLFGIASNTKAFTATALGLLVEEGKISWDSRVRDILPWFRLSDPYVTNELTVLDLLVHRSGLGLGAGDLLWWPPSTYDRKEVARRLRYLPLETSFRGSYAYDNVLYSVAGEVIEEVSGQTWEEFVQGRILDEVGMRGSNVLHSAAGHGDNVASTHARIDGTVRKIAPFASDNTNPAGGINSNAEDMAQWMVVQLDSGRVATGERLFSRRTAQKLWTPVTPMPFGDPPPGLEALRRNFNFYALGFGVRDYRGLKMVTHTGGLPGYVSMLAMIPEKKVGVVVLTNQESGAAFSAIVYEALDRLLGFSDTDWLAAFVDLTSSSNDATAAAEEQLARSRVAGTSPSLSLGQYARSYRDAWYGNVSIREKDGGLEIEFEHSPSLIGSLEHWHHDTFVARWYDRELRADAFVTFALDADGTIDQVKLKPFLPQTDFSYDFQDLLLKPE